ncbi:uncharacterized protein FA14DRAFT_53918 [Meira miltonrushii]|uniref:Phospholipid/glycerol acyltransferase domain-containing protein n=1 Tax=Meira miltonrushii TaxID=1280837 RepID=A0A316VGY7_9BASI|nr:uncharacterized protein FA14DRAFT_53918 [Meira miltonrushii]PWN36298.1 hypothetical protein FA14DRAFT_53918 [Meira miltonrushii]
MASKPYAASSPEYNIPISERKRPTDWVRTILFGVYFNACILFIHSFQYFIGLLYPFPGSRRYYEILIQYTKRGFGKTIVAISQLFAPTTIILTCSDTEGNIINPEELVQRDTNGNVKKIQLPQKSVWISNHQIYTDWLYLWCLAYYSDLADSIFIILMKLYKWLVPIGPAMQFYRFIFLQRKWESDKAYLARHLSYLAHLASDKKSDDAASGSASKLLLLIFPEGTLVSPLTRPVSKKFADKSGIEDCTNLLLPRSTGLLFSLRSLAADIKDLKLVDYTIGYAGVPKAGTGQEYYTLRSTFMQGVAPPAVHVHFTIYSLDQSSPNAPPIGKLSESAAKAAEQDSTQEEKDAFSDWLLQRWREKDAMLTRFYKDGDFISGQYLSKRGQLPKKADGKSDDIPFVEIPVKLRNFFEFGDTIAWGVSIVLIWATYKIIRVVV